MFQSKKRVKSSKIRIYFFRQKLQFPFNVLLMYVKLRQEDHKSSKFTFKIIIL